MEQLVQKIIDKNDNNIDILINFKDVIFALKENNLLIEKNNN